MFASIHAPGNLSILLDCARQFSPLIEITSDDTVTFDVRGLGNRYAGPDKITAEINRRIGLTANIAIAANPDSAVHAARGFVGITVIPNGQEACILAPLSLIFLGCPPSIGEFLDLWGIRSFGQLAGLPPLGIAARLGEEGLYWQQLAQGAVRRQLRLLAEKVSFYREMELEDPVETLEPLLFLLSRFLQELCIELAALSLATNELRLYLLMEKKAEHRIVLRLPSPVSDKKTLLKLLQLNLNERPPMTSILKLRLELEPVQPRRTQEDLFSPAYPSPETIELTIARIRGFVGAGNIGSPRVLDTHKPDSFVMEPFMPSIPLPMNISSPKPSIKLAFRRFRPPPPAQVVVEQRPVRIVSAIARGDVEIARGPWFSCGNWWRTDSWRREEWDIALRGGALYRIFRDLTTERWFVEGNYD